MTIQDESGAPGVPSLPAEADGLVFIQGVPSPGPGPAEQPPGAPAGFVLVGETWRTVGVCPPGTDWITAEAWTVPVEVRLRRAGKGPEPAVVLDALERHAWPGGAALVEARAGESAEPAVAWVKVGCEQLPKDEPARSDADADYRRRARKPVRLRCRRYSAAGVARAARRGQAALFGRCAPRRYNPRAPRLWNAVTCGKRRKVFTPPATGAEVAAWIKANCPKKYDPSALIGPGGKRIPLYWDPNRQLKVPGVDVANPFRPVGSRRRYVAPASAAFGELTPREYRQLEAALAHPDRCTRNPPPPKCDEGLGAILQYNRLYYGAPESAIREKYRLDCERDKREQFRMPTLQDPTNWHVPNRLKKRPAPAIPGRPKTGVDAPAAPSPLAPGPAAEPGSCPYGNLPWYAAPFVTQSADRFKLWLVGATGREICEWYAASGR